MSCSRAQQISKWVNDVQVGFHRHDITTRWKMNGKVIPAHFQLHFSHHSLITIAICAA